MKLKTKRYCFVYAYQIKAQLFIQLYLAFLGLSTINAYGGPPINAECYLHRQNNDGTINEFKFSCREQFQSCSLYIEWPQTLHTAFSIEDLPSFELLVKNCSAPGIAEDKIAKFDATSNMIAVIPNNYFCQFSNLSELCLSANELSESDSYGIATNCESSITTLEMNHNAFLVLRNFSFVGSPNLVELDLSINRISKIDEFAFHKLDHLQWLKLNVNNIHDISEGAFQPLRSLQELDLSKNKLNETSVLSFRPLVSLKILNLEKNKYRSIKAGFFTGLDKLETLLMSSNSIATLKDALSPLTNLVLLELKFNRILSIADAGLCNLHRLKTLSLYLNKISSVPKETFCPNNSIVSLDLTSNQLATFPDIPFLENLQDLDLAVNLMTELSAYDLDVFCHLKNLHHVDIHQNIITSIQPGMFDCLKNLRVLELNNNYLTSVTGLFNVTELKIESLMLQSNQMADFVFDEVPPTVMKLNISRNNFQQFPAFRDSARQNCSMRTLDLSFNPLSGPVQIKELPIYLEHLNFYGSNIDNFSISTGLEHSEEKCTLKSLDLQLNSLYLVCQPLLLLVNRKIPTVQLTENPMVCDCELDYIRKYVTPLKLVSGKGRKPPVITEARLLGLNTTLLDVTQVPNPEDFLCHAPNFGKTTFQCNTHSTYNAKCELSCPDVCLCYVSNKFDAQLINCSSRGLSQFPKMSPSFLLVTLNLSYNLLESLQFDMLASYPNLRALHLDHNLLALLGSDALRAVPRLKHLSLEHNLLSSILPGTFDSLPNLMHLDIAFNRLAFISEDVFQPLGAIRQLQMHNNLLKNYSVWNFGHLESVKTLQVTLRDNPWSCDCDYVEQFRSWLQNYSKVVLDVSQVYCTFSDGIAADTPLISFNASYCYETSPGVVLMGNAPVLAGILAVLVFLSLSAVLVFVYRKEVQVLVYSRYGVRLSHEEEEASDKRYDGFVAYSSLDSDFVVEKLLPGLEGIENHYKLCLHERDFVVGSYISENILEAVGTSHRTIIVLSENFVSSNWCRYEFLMAHLQMLNDKSNRVIVIVLGRIPDKLDPEMKLYLKTNTYLKWGDRLFWEKLYYALPSKVPRTMETD